MLFLHEVASFLKFYIYLLLLLRCCDWYLGVLNVYSQFIYLLTCYCAVGRHSVRLLVNEQPIRIENCSNDDGVCSLEQFITLASVLTNDWTSLTDLCSV